MPNATGDKNKEKKTENERSELEFYKKQSEENLAGWQRSKADFVNYKRNQERHLDEFRKYACEEIIKKILPVVDSFNLACRHVPESIKNSEWTKGVICIKGQLDDFLKEIGVEEVISVGEKFNPDFYEAVGEEESEEEGTITSEIQKGYKMNGRVIRTAKVKVAKRKK